MYEQTRSESIKGKINKKTRNKIFEKIIEDIEIEKKEEARMIKLAERITDVGIGEKTSKAIIEGSSDRMKAVMYDKDKYADTREQNAYDEGFFKHGNRELSGNINKLTDEQLKAIGYNDYLSGVDAETLPEIIKTTPAYTEGYILASILEQKKQKHR